MKGDRGKLPDGVGLVLSIDLDLGPDGGLRGMHVSCASIGLRVPAEVAQRIAVKVQEVVESELFVRDTVDLRSAGA